MIGYKLTVKENGLKTIAILTIMVKSNNELISQIKDIKNKLKSERNFITIIHEKIS